MDADPENIGNQGAFLLGKAGDVAERAPGHASLATTTVYVTTEKRRRMKAVATFWGTGRAAEKGAE